MKLTTTRIRSLSTPGLYGDGNNLSLRITDTGSRSWVFRYTLHGRARVMGLGSLELVSLAEARDKAADARRLLLAGRDPLDQRQEQQAATVMAQARATTFAQAAERTIAAMQGGWSTVHRHNWQRSLRDHVLPKIGGLPVAAIDTDLILHVLEPVWTTKPPTAKILRGRLETVLSYAIARGWRAGPNPAVWRGHLRALLPAIGNVHTAKHHAALDWREAPEFMRQLREDTAAGSFALQFIILTGVRPGREALEATWAEIDEAVATWTVPANRMKTKKMHRVPLSKPALALLQRMKLLRRSDDLIFPGLHPGRWMSHTTPKLVLRRMGRGDLTQHGFRSTFRDWAAEATNYQNHVVEQALAHTIGSAVEAAYRRGDLFEKRRVLMDDWAAFLARPPAEIIPLPRRAARRGRLAARTAAAPDRTADPAGAA